MLRSVPFVPWPFVSVAFYLVAFCLWPFVRWPFVPWFLSVPLLLDIGLSEDRMITTSWFRHLHSRSSTVCHVNETSSLRARAHTHTHILWLYVCIKPGCFLSRVSILTRDIDIANLSVRLSVCLSVRNVPVSDENG